jgi:hypothetical protein
MVSLLDVFMALLERIKTKFSDSNYYLLKLPQKHESPAFLFNLVYNNTSTDNKYLVNKKIDLQIICFNTFDAYGEQDQFEKLEVMSDLDSILSCCNLNVKDRNLKYKYDFGEADENLTINILLEFKDEKVINDIILDNIEQINLRLQEV